ncbi:lysylphosphatidylglycerol synthase domain-containing protein [Wenzhouxiangella sediminis]|nr:lysylphosphatidylglycerol synthase domain-containing protein [Wenzhouxiangella sediminis]
MRAWRWIRRSLTAVSLGAVGYFFAIALAEHLQATEGACLTPDPLTAVAVACFALAVAVSALLWRSILNRSARAESLGRLDAVEVYIAAWLLKYLPGKAWSYAYRAATARARGIELATLLNSFALETLFLLLASTVPAIPIVLAVALTDSAISIQMLSPLLLLLPVLALLHRPTTERLTEFLYRFLRQPKPPKSARMSGRFLAKMQAGYLVPRVLNGVAFVLITHSLYGVTVDMWAPLVAFYMLAGILGSLAFFAPSGIGVREGVLVGLCIHYFNLEQAALLAIITRIYNLLADLALAAVLVSCRARRWMNE